VDALLAQAYEKDFDVGQLVREAAGGGEHKAAQKAQVLDTAIVRVTTDLRQSVVAHHEDLLASAGCLDQLDVEIQKVHESVKKLKVNADAVRKQTVDPFKSLKDKTVLLARVQQTSALARRLTRFMFDARKLRSQLDASTPDLARAALALRDVEAALAEGFVENIIAVQTDVRYIRSASDQVRSAGRRQLRQGLKAADSAALSTGLQIFFNLQSLWAEVKAALDEVLALLENWPQRSSLRGVVTASTFWQEIDWFLNLLFAEASKVAFLDQMLSDKRDTVSDRSFASVLADAGIVSVFAYFWKRAVGVLGGKLSHSAQDKSYAKLLVSLLPDLLKKLGASLDDASKQHKLSKCLKRSERAELMAEIHNLMSRKEIGESRPTGGLGSSQPV